METDRLKKIGACADAVDWVRTQPDAATAWANCTRAGWMIWIVSKALDRRRAVAIFCRCVRTRWDVTTDAGSRCIETAEAWTRGEVTTKAMQSAALTAHANSHDGADVSNATMCDIIRAEVTLAEIERGLADA